MLTQKKYPLLSAGTTDRQSQFQKGAKETAGFVREAEGEEKGCGKKKNLRDRTGKIK